MKRVNLVEFTDVLSWADSNGFGWNGAHEILVKDEVPPMYESKSSEYHIDDVRNGKEVWGWSDDSVKIMTGFMESEKLKECTMINN